MAGYTEIETDPDLTFLYLKKETVEGKTSEFSDLL